jgi:alpha-beta hydrolase superfamily lysophospholipase
VTRIGIRDELLSAQTLRAMGSAPYGGADIGECLAAARRVTGTDLSSWHDAWTAAAMAAQDLAEQELLLAQPPELVQIPYGDTALPGYFFRAAGDPAPRASVILLGGYDSTAEELYFSTGAAALARGYHVLAFDGPGQGAALLQQGLVMRPDWEAVITPVVDDLLTWPEVDAAKIALIGLSLGGYLAPRAASAEHRIAACIADCGSYDLYAAALQRLPGPLAGGLADAAAGRPTRRATLLRRLLELLERRPTAGWALRRGQLVHGVSGPVEYLLTLRDYTLAGRAGSITCPTFVANAEGDDISASAPQLAAALTGEAELVTFTAAEGAGDHCEAGARTLFNARALGWLDRVIQPGPAGDGISGSDRRPDSAGKANG